MQSSCDKIPVSLKALLVSVLGVRGFDDVGDSAVGMWKSGCESFVVWYYLDPQKHAKYTLRLREAEGPR